MSKTPKISIAVCTYNRADVLPKCLESLVDQTADTELFEVLIIDNNSTDDTKKIATDFCKKSSNFKYIFEEKQGLSHARNRAITEANGEYIAYIDDDAIANKDWVKKIESVIQNNKDIAAFGGPIYPWYNKEKPKWFKDEFATHSYGKQHFQLTEQNCPFGLSGSNMIFKKEILNKYNGFSAEYGMTGNKIAFGEESFLFNKMLKNNENIQYFPDIKVSHLVSAKSYSLKEAFKRSIQNGKAIAHIRGSRPLSIDFIKKLSMFCLSLFELTILTLPGIFSKALLYKKLKKFGYFAGYIAGIFSSRNF
ncbi:glycosyltransferase family 2 protein [bacterium]|nr:glycosyltransferase family 2 protein [bacterium]